LHQSGHWSGSLHQSGHWSGSMHHWGWICGCERVLPLAGMKQIDPFFYN
jgi:hypothetical protein